MEILILLFSLFSLAGCQITQIPGQACANTYPEGNVVGGEDIGAELVPWNAVIEIKKNENTDKIVTQCGGNIISRKAILTAAHCVWGNKYYNGHLCPQHIRNQESASECHKLSNGCPTGCLRMRPEDLNIYVGITKVNQTDYRIPQRISRIIIHELWNKSGSFKESIKNGHDLSLIILKHELEFNRRVQAICLPNELLILQPGDVVHVNGFGVVDVFPRTLANHLQTGKMQIKDKDNCNSEYDALPTKTTKRVIQGDQLCAYANSTDSCSGDSGSGLVKLVDSGPVLVGIVSFGSKYCRQLPGVYTNVQTHVDWILHKLLNIPNSPEPAIAQTSQSCSENETCRVRESCRYVQQKYIEIKEADTREQQINIIKSLKAKVCNKQKKAFCCPIEHK